MKKASKIYLWTWLVFVVAAIVAVVVAMVMPSHHDLARDPYAIDCEIHHDHAHLTYTVDESEGIFLFVAFLLCGYLMLLWGVVLIVIGVVKRIVKNKKQQ